MVIRRVLQLLSNKFLYPRVRSRTRDVDNVCNFSRSLAPTVIPDFRISSSTWTDPARTEENIQCAISSSLFARLDSTHASFTRHVPFSIVNHRIASVLYGTSGRMNVHRKSVASLFRSNSSMYLRVIFETHLWHLIAS